MGAGRGGRQGGSAMGGDSISSESSLRFPVNGTYEVSFHSGGVGA